eukprot:scaffold247_cov274-Pinguiococcus_pyrenoidosus.AAC.8
MREATHLSASSLPRRLTSITAASSPGPYVPQSSALGKGSCRTCGKMPHDPPSVASSPPGTGDTTNTRSIQRGRTACRVKPPAKHK